jgi:hypothetical protein
MPKLRITWPLLAGVVGAAWAFKQLTVPDPLHSYIAFVLWLSSFLLGMGWLIQRWSLGLRSQHREKRMQILIAMIVTLVGAGGSLVIWALVGPDGSRQDPLIRASQAQHDPVVRLEPLGHINGTGGKLRLTLVNSGIPDIEHIEIYDDFYVVRKPDDQPMKLILAGGIKTTPPQTIATLATDQRKEFTVPSDDTVVQELQKTYFQVINTPPPAHTMCIMNVMLRYRRSADGKQFQFAKMYLIGGTDLDVAVDIDGATQVFTYGWIPGITVEGLKAAVAKAY